MIAAILAAIAASVAGATPPSNFAGVVTSRGTVASDAFKVTVPERVTVTQKYKVKVRVKGKLVTRTRTRQVVKTVDTAINTCGATACDVVTQTVTVQPGGFSGWHHHPGLVLVVVKSGSVVRYFTDCRSQTFNAGQGFAELGEKQLAAFVKNQGSTVAELMVTYVTPPGAPLRSEVDAPANCNP